MRRMETFGERYQERTPCLTPSFVAMGLVFFAAMSLYVYACDRL